MELRLLRVRGVAASVLGDEPILSLFYQKLFHALATNPDEQEAQRKAGDDQVF